MRRGGSVLAVDFFRSFGGGDHGVSGVIGVQFDEAGEPTNSFTTVQGNQVDGTRNTTLSAVTGRGFTIGEEYYGTFSRSLYTLFQVLTGESWSEVIARPLLFGFDTNALFVGVFFTSYILFMQIVLVNVVVAVLLEKFVQEPEVKSEGEGEGEGEGGGEGEVAGGGEGKGGGRGEGEGEGEGEAFGRQSLMPMATIDPRLEARVAEIERKLDLLVQHLVPPGGAGGSAARAPGAACEAC